MTFISLARAGLTGAGLLLAMWLPGWVAAAGLNDTGVTKCADATQNNLTCSQVGFPSQDAETGRDAQAGLQKAGGGSAGFDFTKVCNSGEPAGQGNCPANPSLGTGPNDWACTRDNVTGLIWEVKTDNATPDLRDQDWTYTWCNNNAATNGGSAGMCDTGSNGSNNCFNSARCDTEKYVQDVNTAGLCGYTTGWRMPTLEELRGLVNYSIYGGGVSPTIDISYFPNTRPSIYWSASPYAPNAGYAWGVGFGNGYGDAYDEGYGSLAVRLVRGGQ